MPGAYDYTYSHFNSSSQAFQRAQSRILKLVKRTKIIKELNLKYLYKTVDYPKKTSTIIRQTLCPYCQEEQELCEENRDEKRRYRCRALSMTTGTNVRLYLPSPHDKYAMKEKLKRYIMQVVVREPGITQSQIAKRVRANKLTVRACLDELVGRGILSCSENRERGVTTKRYVLLMD